MERNKLFLACSAEFREDRREFEIFVNRENRDWHAKGVFLDLMVWEDFLDALSRTRLQDEYNRAIRECDLFVMLFWTRVGRYTEEEFETPVGQFEATDKPFIFTYFKDAEVSPSSSNKQDWLGLWAFQEKLDSLGHFYTRYRNSDAQTALWRGCGGNAPRCPSVAINTAGAPALSGVRRTRAPAAARGDTETVKARRTVRDRC